MLQSLPLLPKRRRKRQRPHRLLMILRRWNPRPSRRAMQLQSFQHHPRRPMPTRTRKAREGREDHRHLLTRRRSFATTSSTKVDAIKVTNVYTVIPKRSMMQRWRERKVEVEVVILQGKGAREVLLQQDPKREYAGNGKRGHAHLEVSANSSMQINPHRHHLNGPMSRTRRRKPLLSPSIHSLTVIVKMQMTILLRR